MRRRKFLSLLGAAGVAALGWKFWRRRKMSVQLYIAEGTRIRKFTVGGNISTLAGGGSGGYSGDGGPATSALMTSPGGAVQDAAGNVYIGDVNNYVVRKVALDGKIATFAGSNVRGYSGDGGAATAAQMKELGVSAVAVDADGNLYIADSANHVVRKVDHATGIITTFAGIQANGGDWTGDGGQAAAADLDHPDGLFVDGDNLYIADSKNSSVRKVVISTGIITTVAGKGDYALDSTGDGGLATAAELGFPVDVCTDASGNLYIAEPNGSVVRKVDHITGFISTVAGMIDLPGFTGDGGLATGAKLDSPEAVRVVSGVLYIADYNNNRVRAVDLTSGIITTVAGNGTAGATGDGGPAISAEIDHPNSLGVVLTPAAAEEPQIFITT